MPAGAAASLSALRLSRPFPTETAGIAVSGSDNRKLRGGWFPRLNIWPVVQRELREGARRPVNHRLRLWSAGVGTLLFYGVVANSDELAVQMGGWLLGGLHSLLLGLIFLIVPALAADCIARERREGTLGLLFLTPLTAGGIVAGKMLVQGLRAFTLWLAALPLLTIPFLAGGITWLDALSAFSLEFSAAELCLAAGLLASSLARERSTAFLLAFLLAAGFLLLFNLLFYVVFFVWWQGLPVLKAADLWQLGLKAMSSVLTELSGVRVWAAQSSPTTASSTVAGIWRRLCLLSPLVTILIFYAACRFAARRVERSWQDHVPSAWHNRLIRWHGTPFLRSVFRLKMQEYLDWNPIAWLQQYSWKARVSKWWLCLVFLLIGCVACTAPEPGRDSTLIVLMLTLAGFYTFAGISGFLEEKRSGALELLLVTPVSANQLIFGRAWGLWKQFLPASLVFAVFYASRQWTRHWSDPFSSATLQLDGILVCSFFTLPVFATYFALRVRNSLVGAAMTWAALCVPALFTAEATQLFAGRYWAEANLLPPLILLLLSNGVLALLACFLLGHSLSRRLYSF